MEWNARPSKKVTEAKNREGKTRACHDQSQGKGASDREPGHLRGLQNAPNLEDVHQRKGQAQGGEDLRSQQSRQHHTRQKGRSWHQNGGRKNARRYQKSKEEEEQRRTWYQPRQPTLKETRQELIIRS